jgi:hypothetical protein
LNPRHTIDAVARKLKYGKCNKAYLLYSEEKPGKRICQGFSGIENQDSAFRSLKKA